MRESLRRVAVLIALFAAAAIPFVSSGYSEIRKAETASSHLDAAGHYQAAAMRLLWRPDLYELAGHHLYYAGEYSEADVVYEKAFKRNTLSPDGWVAWGDVIYLNGDFERAAEIWGQGLGQPNASEKLYSRLAQTYQEGRDYAKAAEYLRLYVDDHADDASARYRLGLLLTLTNPNEALTELISASQLDPQFDPAVQTLRTALNLSLLSGTSSEQKVVIGRGLGLVNEWELALAIFNDAVKLDEKNSEAWAWLGEADQQTGNPEAFEHLDRALNLDPNSSVVRGLRGLYFQRVGNHREALVEYQAAARLDPENPVWFVSIGEEFTKLGNLILAMEAYQYTTTLAPDDPQYWRLLAGFCAQNNANVRDVGIPAAQTAVKLSPDDPLALDMLGWLLIIDGRYYEAEKILTDALSLDPQVGSVQFHLGLLYLEWNDRAAAFEHLVNARDLGSSDAQVLLNQEFP